MKYIKNEDYEYIKNKYHDTKKPFDSFSRFIRHDEIFSEDTGLSAEEIIQGIRAQDKEIEHLSHYERKSLALKYVLENTRISCDRRDIFPALNATDRPLNQTLIGLWKWELFTKIIPEVEKKRKVLESEGIVTIWPDYDHSVPMWENVFSLGYSGILEVCEKRRARGGLDKEQEDFFEGIKLTYEAIIAFIGRLAALAEKTEGSERMAKALRSIEKGAPKTFYEALLSSYLYFMISEHIDALQVRSLSNFDRVFYPFYINDLKNGVTEEQIRTDLAYYFMQFTAIGNYWGQPGFLGWSNPDGSSAINELSYLFLDVYDEMGIYNPKVQLKVCRRTPEKFIKKALDMIRRGHNSLVFVNDDLVQASMIREGASADEARLANIKGCYEYDLRDSFDCGMNYTNLLKPLEFALHQGCDGVSHAMRGLPCKAPEEYESFDELYAEYKHQLLYLLNYIIDVVNGFEDHLTYINPLPMLSATIPSCVESGRDAMHGGASLNISGIMLGYIADTADSLAMIKKYVFDNKEFTLPELVRMLDENFENDPFVRKKLLADRDKYGNNKDLPDVIAVDIAKFCTENVCGRDTSKERRGKWTVGYHNARMSYIQGKITATSANGRLLGEELSKNLSASMGQNREGATAAILSTTKIDTAKFTGDACLDLGLLPSAVSGEDGLNAMYGLLMTFFERMGHAIHINVFNAETLRDAQAHPEKYADLQIRVCGWNVLWNDINKEEQDGFIRQAESLI